MLLTLLIYRCLLLSFLIEDVRERDRLRADFAIRKGNRLRIILLRVLLVVLEPYYVTSTTLPTGYYPRLFYSI